MAFNTNAQTYSVKQVSDMSGVSIRTLHHFEDAGLIKPGRMANGYRAYVAADLDRLQQILLYRACGVKLGDIKSILDDASFDPEKALLGHRRALEAQRDELVGVEKQLDETKKALAEEQTKLGQARAKVSAHQVAEQIDGVREDVSRRLTAFGTKLEELEKKQNEAAKQGGLE